jgi:hypothetical protein
MKKTLLLAVALVGATYWYQQAHTSSTPTMDMDQASNTLEFPTSTVKNSGPTKIGISGKIVVTYTTFDNRPVELVYEPYQNVGRVTLRIKGRDYRDTIGNNNLLVFMEQAVIVLTGSEFPKLMPAKPGVGKTTKLGETGYYFMYEGGYPIWAPHSTFGPDGNYSCLFFAENATFNGETIKASGRPDIIGYNGYAEYKGR